jgi:7,8-dihydroneopterin aldolase/epimerase/oxygenase
VTTSAVPDRIELRGLRLVGRVGLLDHERAQPQPLEVDLDLSVDMSAAGASDDLADTVDYAAVCDTVAATVGERHVDLLEHLTTRVADAVLALDGRIASVDVAVRKLRPPVPHDLASSGVRIVRDRL